MRLSGRFILPMPMWWSRPLTSLRTKLRATVSVRTDSKFPDVSGDGGSPCRSARAERVRSGEPESREHIVGHLPVGRAYVDCDTTLVGLEWLECVELGL